MDVRASSGDVDFAAVFAALPGATGVFAADAPRFTVLAASNSLLTVAQRPRDAVVGRALEQAFPSAGPHDPHATALADLRTSLAAAVSTGAPQRMARQRYDLQQPDGKWETRYWDAINIPVSGPDGTVRHVLHQTVDVTAQVLSEQAAAQANRRAERILERMGDAHCVLDHNFRIIGVNVATERVLGRPRETLLGRSHWEVFPASFDAPVGQAFRRVVAEKIEQHLTHRYTGEGYDFHVEVDAYPTDEGGLAMFWRDITERVRAQATLGESEEKYRALFNEMDEAYAVVEVIADTEGRWTDFLFLEVNAAFMRHTGMPYPVGRTATELLGVPNPRWAALYGGVAETGESIRVEEAELMLGRIFDLNIFRLGGEGSRRVAVLFTDITERRRAEDALRESERRYRLLFENMGEGFALAEMIWDEDGKPADWRLVEVNAAWGQTGVPVSETIGKTARELNPDIEPYWIDTYARVVQTGQPVAFENYAKGLGKWFDTVAFKHSENRFGLIFRDVSERRASVERHAFLLRLGDALRGEADPEAVKAVVCRILGEQLGVSRVFYADITGDDWVVTGAYEHGTDRQADGRHPVAQFGEWILALFRAGRRLVFDDLHSDARFSPPERAVHEAYNILGAVSFPLVKDGVLVAILAVHSATPRAWQEDEIALVEETAERTWAAVERARAEAALRASEQRRLLGLDAAGIGDWSYEVATGALDCSPRARAMHGVESGEPVTFELHDRLIDPADRAAVQAARARALDPAGGGGYRFEFRFYPVGGEMRWIESVGRGVFEDSPDGPRATHVIGAMVDVTERKASEVALQQARDSLEARVRERTAEVQSLFARLVSAQEEERRRIARDIHDQLGQQMTALRMNIAALRVHADNSPAAGQARRTERLAEELDRTIDFLAWELRPAALDHLGLSAVLAHFVREWSERFEIPAEYDSFGIDGARFAPALETNLYRLTQEALHNVYKHADARRVSVLLEQRDARLVLVIEDDGVGFAHDSHHGVKTGSLGLANMRERAMLSGGELTIDSTPGHGTSLIVRVPVGSEDVGPGEKTDAPAR